MLFLCACSVQKEDKEKLRDIDFTVVDSYDAPEELQKKIDEKKEKTFEISYADNGYLYIARGYGSQDTSGYSVEVKECFEAKDGIYLKTNLLGPPKTEEISRSPWYWGTKGVTMASSTKVIINTVWMVLNVIFRSSIKYELIKRGIFNTRVMAPIGIRVK